MGSRSQLVSGDLERRLETSSIVTGVKEEKQGGVNGGDMCGEVEV